MLIMMLTGFYNNLANRLLCVIAFTIVNVLFGLNVHVEGRMSIERARQRESGPRRGVWIYTVWWICTHSLQWKLAKDIHAFTRAAQVHQCNLEFVSVALLKMLVQWFYRAACRVHSLIDCFKYLLLYALMSRDQRVIAAFAVRKLHFIISRYYCKCNISFSPNQNSEGRIYDVCMVVLQ